MRLNAKLAQAGNAMSAWLVLVLKKSHMIGKRFATARTSCPGHDKPQDGSRTEYLHIQEVCTRSN
jgi:hypothetical protein